jgi:hypothetical protein
MKTFVTTFFVRPAVLDPAMANEIAYPVGHATN